MSFFQNKAVNLLNIHIALIRLASLFSGIFVPVFLLQKGLSIPVICLFSALGSLIRIPARIFQVPLVKKIGIKPAVIIGIIGVGISYLFLTLAQGIDVYLWLYVIIGGIFSALYWQLFHYLFAHYGDNHERGQNVSMQIIFVELIQIIGPLLGAIIINYQGFFSYTIFIFLILFLAIIFILPLSKYPSIKNICSLSKAFKEENKYGMKISILSSATEASYTYIWIIVIYLTLGELVSFGSALTLGILISVILQAIIGKYIDKGKGKSVNFAGLGLSLFTLFGRVLLGYSLFFISIFEGASRFSRNVNDSVFSVSYYNKAKDSKESFWHILLAETGWDLGSIAGLIGVALLIFIGVSPRFAMLIGIIPMILLWRVLHNYYRNIEN